MWPGYSSPPMPRGNGLRRCCGAEPVLRVDQQRLIGGQPVIFFQCRQCGRESGRTARFMPPAEYEQDSDEVRARVLWSEEVAWG
jgi:hypothetical protein